MPRHYFSSEFFPFTPPQGQLALRLTPCIAAWRPQPSMQGQERPRKGGCIFYQKVGWITGG